MARAEGMELPDVLRMMLIKAVRDRSFSISLADLEQPTEEREDLDPFEPRYWGPFRARRRVGTRPAVQGRCR
jgi:hypothetical protein